jgi:hypothetical protein
MNLTGCLEETGHDSITQGLSALALVLALSVAVAVVTLLAMMSLLPIAVSARETRGCDLRELDSGQDSRLRHCPSDSRNI